jgi:TPR repeat protein
LAAGSSLDGGRALTNANPADHVKAQSGRRPAELGSSAGMVDLGNLYAPGKGIEQNDALVARAASR